MNQQELDEMKERVFEIIRNGNSVTITGIGYRFENRMDGRKKMSKRIIHDLLAMLIAEGRVVEQYQDGARRYKPATPNLLDAIFGMVAKPIDTNRVVKHTTESMGDRKSYGGSVHRGYRSYWEAVDWPVGA